MNCSQCHEEVPSDYHETSCPSCGARLERQLPPVKVNWPAFFIFLLSPMVLTILAVVAHPVHNELAANVGLIGGMLGGICSGVMLAFGLARNANVRILLTLLFACIMMVVCVGLCFGGCVASGYKYQY